LLIPFASLQGCGNLNGVDRRINRLVDDRTTLIGGDSYPPSQKSWPEPTGLSDPALTDKKVPTTNPAPQDLRFKIADESRNVEERLQALMAPEPGEALRMNLKAAFHQSQKTAREYITEEENYILAAIGLLAERHMWSPRFFNNTSLDFSNVPVDGDNNTALRLVNELRATQRLPYGGEFAARWLWEAAENLRSSATGQYTQASRLSLDASIPLMRGAGLVAQEGLIQAERDLIYAARDFEDFRREFLVSIARDYFDLLATHASLLNSEKQLELLLREQRERQALFEAGRIAQFELNNIANQVRSEQASVANQREVYALQLDRFKIRLGLDVHEPIVIEEDELAIPEPDITLPEATELALLYRLDLQNVRDRVEDARRAVKNARNDLLPDLDIRGGVVFPSDADEDEGGIVYELDDTTYSAGLSFGMPLDRELERLALRRSVIQLEQAQREYSRARDDVVVEVRSRVRRIELARFNLQLAEERVKLTELRRREQELKEEEVTTQEKLDTLADLLDAENARVQALTALRSSVLDYLLATGQLRVTRDGELHRLPGMGEEPEAKEPEPGMDADQR
jgi:outer membrane protein TolC